MHPSRTFALVLVLPLLLATVSPVRAEDPPVVSIKALQQRIASESGHPFVLVYWASWCVPCRHFRKKLETLRSRYPEEQLHMLAVSLDSDRQRVRDYLAKSPLPYPTVIADKALRAESMGGVPTTVLYRRDGSVERRLVGDVAEARLNHYIRRILQPETPPQQGRPVEQGRSETR